MGSAEAKPGLAHSVHNSASQNIRIPLLCSSLGAQWVSAPLHPSSGWWDPFGNPEKVDTNCSSVINVGRIIPRATAKSSLTK